MNLQASIDSAFKHEPTYQIKIAKLENLDKKRINIQRLIDRTENLILYEERQFSSRLPTKSWIAFCWSCAVNFSSPHTA